MMVIKYDVWAKLSAAPLYKARMKQPEEWKLKKIERALKNRTIKGGKIGEGMRTKVKTYSFKYIGKQATHEETGKTYNELKAERG